MTLALIAGIAPNMGRPRFPNEQFSAAQFGALLDDDDTTPPGFSMHQTPVLEPSRLREREAE